MSEPRRRRILLAGTGLGELSPRASAVALARGFADSAEVAVVGLAEGGRRLASALTEPDGEVEPLERGWLARTDALVAVGVDDPAPADPLDATSAATGSVLGYALARSGAGRVVVDLTGSRAHDAGAGLLGALGAQADVDLGGGAQALAALTRLDLAAVRAALAGRTLVGVIAESQRADQLLGLRGITSRRGRELGTDAARMLALDAALERFAGLVDPSGAARPGAGAAGGLGFVVQALGGRLATGPELIAEQTGLERGLAAADLVVVACDSYDFGSRGGPVVTELSQWCERAMTPLVVVSPVIDISGREMRVMGVESAHPVPTDRDPAAALEATARRLASGWSSRW